MICPFVKRLRLIRPYPSRSDGYIVGGTSYKKCLGVHRLPVVEFPAVSYR